MVYPINFYFRGQAYTANAHLSLQEDGCYIFCIIEDKALIAEFGTDIDIHTDCDHVLSSKDTNDCIDALKTAILDAVKQLAQFQEQKPRKLFIRGKQVY